MSGRVTFSGGWIEVGRYHDPDRRRHWAHFDPISAGIGEPPRLFITVADVRSIMVNGQWKMARRINPALRLPDDVIGDGEYTPDRPLKGLLASEAETLTHLLGGRLPNEKELDRITSAHQPWSPAGEAWAAWTQSRWSLLSYSLSCWNAQLGRWESPIKNSLRAVGVEIRSILRWDGRQLVREPCDPLDARETRVAMVFNV